MFRILPQISHQTPFNSDYFFNLLHVVYKLLSFETSLHNCYSVCCFIRHLTETNMKSINLYYCTNIALFLVQHSHAGWLVCKSREWKN